MDKVRLVIIGNRSDDVALRVARGATGPIEDCQNRRGVSQPMPTVCWVAAGSGAATLGLPGSAGSPEGRARYTDGAVERFAAIEAVFRDHRSADGQSEIAAVIIEPVSWQHGCVAPEPGYLEHLRKSQPTRAPC